MKVLLKTAILALALTASAGTSASAGGLGGILKGLVKEINRGCNSNLAANTGCGWVIQDGVTWGGSQYIENFPRGEMIYDPWGSANTTPQWWMRDDVWAPIGQ
jgi:hypothetical protein